MLTSISMQLSIHGGFILPTEFGHCRPIVLPLPNMSRLDLVGARSTDPLASYSLTRLL